MANKNLNAAKTAKKDEFYTQMFDIERELKHYTTHFKDKVVLCNCDDPYESNFFKYFALSFNQLQLKKLICTCYNGSPVQGNELMLDFGDFEEEPKKMAYKVEITEVKDLNGDGAVDLSDVQYLLKNDKNVISTLRTGDFRDPECIELLKQADIVVTNPPFSLFREYIAQLVEYEKKFLIIGNKAAINGKDIFPLIKDNKVWVGYTPMNVDLLFIVPKKSEEEYLANGKEGSNYKIVNGKVFGRSPSIWYTNLDHNKRHESLDLVCHYSPEEYIHYENYDAIEVGQVTDIPYDYEGIMGVPVSFLDKYNPEQFEIVGSNCSTELCVELGVKPLGEDWIRRYRAAGGTGHNTANMVRIVYNDSHGKPKVAFSRLFIRNKHPRQL